MLEELIGIYGGSFDPFHNGHLRLLEGVQKRFRFKKIIIVPTYNSPHKENSLFSNQERISIIESAVCSFSYFEIDDIEISKGKVCYTYDTVTELHQKYSHTKFYFLMGVDAWSLRFSWHRINDLMKILNFIIVGRPSRERRIDDSITRDLYTANNITYHEGEMLDISATQIKGLLLKGEDISSYVAPDTCELINNFYQNK
jgi:nicotinate-nucleotide adenylyltransferase